MRLDAFLAGLPVDKVLVLLASIAGTVVLAVGAQFAVIFFPEPEWEK